MEQNDKTPVGQAGDPRPHRQEQPEGGADPRNGGEGGHNRRRRNRHRNRNRGDREKLPEGVATEARAEGTATEAKAEDASRRDSSSRPAEEGSGEEKKRRRNRHRNRNRGERAPTDPSADTETILLSEEETAEANEVTVETVEAESRADLLPELTEEIPASEEAREPQEAKEPKAPKKPLYTVTGIRFRPSGKIYYFDPAGLACAEGAHVIVETARGLEYGIVALETRQVSGKDVVLPLRRVVRMATEEDERRHESNLEKETEAFNLCLSRIEAHRLDMKLVDVEYAFDNSKLLFYFTSEDRVDFRDLVKDLASVFRTRIELRQIGIRDEAKLMGGLGVCGRPFCCKSFLPDFVQVSIKMAKEQNLSLNSAKISGACGRLMCCLRYEYDTYVEESALTPKVDAIVDTPDGEGIVTESSPLKGIVKVVLDKEPNASHIYRREDVTVKGHAKKRKNNENDGKNAAEKK